MRDGYGGEYFVSTQAWNRESTTGKAVLAAERTGTVQLVHKHRHSEPCLGASHIRVVPGCDPEEVEITC